MVRSVWLRYLLLGAGWVCVMLGVIGIFLPVMPTTPFLLLAAFCFARSSERVHHWLTHHPQLGPPVRAFLNGEGIPARVKCIAIGMTWLGIAVSSWLVPLPWARLVMVVGGLIATFVILQQKTRTEPTQ